MANAILAYDDYVDRGVISTTSEMFNLPAINLQQPQLSPYVWRSNSTTTAALTVDFGLARDVDVVALLKANLSATGTWRVRLDSDSGFATPHLFDSGTVVPGIDPFFGTMLCILPTTVTARYLRIDLSDATLAYLEAGRLFAASAWRMAHNFAFGLREGWEDASSKSRAEAGQMWVDLGATWRVWTFDLPAIGETEKNAHVLKWGRFGRARDMLFVKDPASSNLGRDSIFGLPSVAPQSRLARYQSYEMTVTVEERL